MKKIIWTQRGLDSLDSIAQFIARDSEYYASSFIKKILELVEILQFYPYLGRVVPEIRETNIRELIYHNYRIVYKIDDKTISILLVLHAMKLFPNDL